MVYVCSDIHGDYGKYAALLKRLDMKEEDTLYILGDVIDRGPDGIKILLDMMNRFQVVPILGNHEFLAAVCLKWLLAEIAEERLDSLGMAQLAAYQNWMDNGGGPTLAQLRRLSRTEREEVLAYLLEMDLYAQVEAGNRSFVLVHAGLDHFSPDKSLEDYDIEELLFCRPTLEQTYYQDRFLIYGHTPTRLLRQQLGEPPADTILRRGNQIAIDCGCGWGGQLGCLCLETLEEIYI